MVITMKTWKWIGSSVATTALLLFGGYPLSAESLQEAMQTTLQNHPELRTGYHNRLARKEEIRQARSGYLPQLDVIAGVGYGETQKPVDDTADPRMLTLSLRQNLFTGFATKGEVERQEFRVLSATHSTQATAEFVALRTADVYLEVLRQEELLQLAEENLATHLRIGDQIRLRSDAGVSTTTDSDQVSSRVALARANVVAAKTNLADARTNYLAVVGHLPEKLQKPEPVIEELPPSLESAETLAVDEHPTLKSAEADLAARQKQHDVARAPYLPVVDFEFDHNWQEDYTEVIETQEWIALVRLRYNLFQGFRDVGRRAETAEQINEAREIRNNTQRQVVESIRLSWMANEAVLERIGYLEDRVTTTVATADAYAKQFNIGKRALLDLLDTEAEVIDAKKARVEASYDGLFAQYRILNGFGGLLAAMGLEVDLDTERQPAVEAQPRQQHIVVNEAILVSPERWAVKP